MNTAVAEQIRTTVEARLRELAPVLDELEQLRGVLAILEDPETCRQLIGAPALLSEHAQPESDPASRVTPLRRSRRLGSKPGRDGRAPQGANKERILAVIAEHPGIAAPQIAKLTGLKRPVVASTISRLKRTGELRAHGGGVRIAEAHLSLAFPSAGDLSEIAASERRPLTHAAAGPG
jgi:Winged helix-turn-helix DNA-binding